MITAIIPVYNEEKTVRDVLKVVTTHKRIDKVIVVNDGSTDSTPKIIKKFNVEVISPYHNLGKGEAVRMAARNLDDGILLLIDADLINLNHKHIDTLLDSVVKNKAAMVIGLRDKKNVFADKIMPYFPLTGGERAILVGVFKKIIKNDLIAGWGLEYVMNDYCKKNNLVMHTVKLKGLNHIGLLNDKRGWRAFLKEIYDVSVVKLRLLTVKYD